MMPRDAPTTLWTLRREGREIACLVRLEPHGIEVDMTSDGAISATRTFGTGDEALAWAEARRQRRESEGWEPGPDTIDGPLRVS